MAKMKKNLMLSYNLETLTDDLVKEMMERQDEYKEEAEGAFHPFPPDVAWESYKMLQQKNVLHIICGRDDKGNLKATAFIMVTPHPHYACIVATLPLIFIAREARKGREGIRFIKLVEKTAEEHGAQMVLAQGGTHNGVARIFDFMKYGELGRYFIKVLGHGPNGLNPVFKGEMKCQ